MHSHTRAHTHTHTHTHIATQVEWAFSIWPQTICVSLYTCTANIEAPLNKSFSPPQHTPQSTSPCRSLVALSLILALLLFKPAPVYILDEVDAALDLSHTQNIGQMLKTHFTHSQFIVVSLKDGMFNNANVLFKTKFVDGVSTVTRFRLYVVVLPSRYSEKVTTCM